MCEENTFMKDIEEQIKEQANSIDIPSDDCDVNIERTGYSIEEKILISISSNVNTMAEAIKESEEQKNEERKKYVLFFKRILCSLIFVVILSIIVDTFSDYTVKIEFLVSVVLVILADVFAIIQTLVKYMTNVENYDAYSKLIDSLLKYTVKK